MFYIPLWSVLLLWASGVTAGGLVMYIYGPRRRVEVDRTEQKEVRALNVFDAYSDSDMAKLRKEAADSVKHYRSYGGKLMLEEKVKVLREIDDEINARKNAQIALEETKRTAQERDIAIFDTVYGHLLKDTEKKEIT